ncbi:hypothetical protein [Terrimicrobium sacchariphilum]|nr:hypothetical protein [Terrimicrobium sacchariphilum]
MMWTAIGTTVVSVAATGVGTGMSYFAAQDQASQQAAITNQNYAIQKRNAQIQAKIGQQQAKYKKAYAMAGYKAKQENALTYEAQADAINTQAREAARRMREQNDAALATQRAAVSASGVTTEGSPIIALAESAGRLELAVQDSKWQSDVQAQQYREAAKQERYQSAFDLIDTHIADYEGKLAKVGLSLNLDQAALTRSAGLSESSATRTAAYGTLLSGFSSMASQVGGTDWSQFTKTTPGGRYNPLAPVRKAIRVT